MRVLGTQRVVDGPANGRRQTFVSGHGIRLAQREGRHRVTVHERERAGPAAEIAVAGVLRAKQIFDRPLNVVPIITLEVRVTRSEKRQQGQAGDRRVSSGAGTFAILSVDAWLPAGAVHSWIPAPVAALDLGEPIQRRPHGRFGFGIAAASFHNAPPVRGGAKSIGIGQGPVITGAARRGDLRRGGHNQHVLDRLVCRWCRRLQQQFVARGQRFGRGSSGRRFVETLFEGVARRQLALGIVGSGATRKTCCVATDEPPRIWRLWLPGRRVVATLGANRVDLLGVGRLRLSSRRIGQRSARRRTGGFKKLLRSRRCARQFDLFIDTPLDGWAICERPEFDVLQTQFRRLCGKALPRPRLLRLDVVRHVSVILNNRNLDGRQHVLRTAALGDDDGCGVNEQDIMGEDRQNSPLRQRVREVPPAPQGDDENDAPNDRPRPQQHVERRWVFDQHLRDEVSHGDLPGGITLTEIPSFETPAWVQAL